MAELTKRMKKKEAKKMLLSMRDPRFDELNRVCREIANRNLDVLKLMEIKKQIDKITKEVTNYISYITEETEAEFVEEEQVHKWERAKEKEEVQNRLIQEVLSEYFP